MSQRQNQLPYLTEFGLILKVRYRMFIPKSQMFQIKNSKFLCIFHTSFLLYCNLRPQVVCVPTKRWFKDFLLNTKKVVPICRRKILFISKFIYGNLRAFSSWISWSCPWPWPPPAWWRQILCTWYPATTETTELFPGRKSSLTVLRIRGVYPESRILIFSTRVQGQNGTVQYRLTKNLWKVVILTQLSEIWSVMLIPDPEYFHPG